MMQACSKENETAIVNTRKWMRRMHISLMQQGDARRMTHHECETLTQLLTEPWYHLSANQKEATWFTKAIGLMMKRDLVALRELLTYIRKKISNAGPGAARTTPPLCPR